MIYETTLSGRGISDSRAHILLCGLGLPLQEMWISVNVEYSGAVMVGVGAAFSYMSQHKKMAPAWMKKIGLEWLLRLLSDPLRLGSRYIQSISHFLFLVNRQFLTNLFKSH